MVQSAGVLRLLAKYIALRWWELRIDHDFALSETGAFGFLHGFSMVKSRMIVDRWMNHYFGPRAGMELEDSSDQMDPDGAKGRRHNLVQVERKVLKGRYDRSAARSFYSRRMVHSVALYWCRGSSSCVYHIRYGLPRMGSHS